MSEAYSLDNAQTDDDNAIVGIESGRVLIVSDSHSRNDNLYTVMERVEPDLILHLGDSEDMEDEIAAVADCPVVIVSGNCDYGSALPDHAVVTLGVHRALLVHGHRQGVGYGLNGLLTLASELRCDIAMYGHTHIPEITEEDGITVYNPGSISLPRQDGRRPTFIVLDIDKNGHLHPTLNTLGDKRREKMPRNKKSWFLW